MKKILLICSMLFMAGPAAAEVANCEGGIAPGGCACAVGSMRKNCSASGALTQTNTGNSISGCCASGCSTEGFQCSNYSGMNPNESLSKLSKGSASGAQLSAGSSKKPKPKTAGKKK
jgi:hypothetical protein